MSLQSKSGRGATWRRGLFMLLFALLYSVAEMVLTAIVLFQFGSMLISGRLNKPLGEFSSSLALYIYQVIMFLTFRTEVHPYPFTAWPPVKDVMEQHAEPIEDYTTNGSAEDGG